MIFSLHLLLLHSVLQEKAVVIRLSRIIYAFRNQVWPKPMEGLDLFNPVSAACKNVSDSSSDEMSSAEGGMESGHDSDPDWNAKKEKSSGKHKGGGSLPSDKMDTSSHSSLLVRISPKTPGETSAKPAVTSTSFQVEKVILLHSTEIV